MSYDSIRMLEEARSTVRGGIYPAAPVYILRFFDMTGYGVTAMLQVQNFVLLLSMALILRMLDASSIKSAIALLALVATPTVVGCMLVLWKDVTLTALMMLSIVIIFWASRTSAKSTVYYAAKWAALPLLTLGALVRFNALTATLVIALYWVAVFFRHQNRQRRAGVFVAVLICMVASNKVINSYSFPDLKKLDVNPIVYAIMINDLIGISGWSRVSLIPIDSTRSAPQAKASIADIDKIYSSLGALAMNDNNMAIGNVVKVFPKQYKNEDITRAWLDGILGHPIAYLRYRWDLFAEIIGAKSHATFEPTHFNRIDENAFGIEFRDRWITRITLQYIQWASNVFYGKPWFVFLLSIIAIALVYKSKIIHEADKNLAYYSFAAALLYIAPFFIITGTGEVRYSFPSIVLGSIAVFVWIFRHYLPQHNSSTQRKLGHIG